MIVSESDCDIRGGRSSLSTELMNLFPRVTADTGVQVHQVLRIDHQSDEHAYKSSKYLWILYRLPARPINQHLRFLRVNRYRRRRLSFIKLHKTHLALRTIEHGYPNFRTYRNINSRAKDDDDSEYGQERRFVVQDETFEEQGPDDLPGHSRWILVQLFRSWGRMVSPGCRYP